VLEAASEAYLEPICTSLGRLALVEHVIALHQLAILMPNAGEPECCTGREGLCGISINLLMRCHTLYQQACHELKLELSILNLSDFTLLEAASYMHHFP
jgi:hypothetical protein